MLSVDFASLSDRGRVRLNNEDSCGQFVPETASEVDERGMVFVVADGMGGTAVARSPVASQSGPFWPGTPPTPVTTGRTR